jgi:predicted nucleotidyltransferase
MIEKNNNLKVMELFFKFPERKFHLRELERLTKLSLPAVRNICQKLEKKGLLESKKEKIVKNFYATRNQKFIQLKRIYNIQSLFSIGLVDYLKNIYEEPEAIVLFGSYSKGEDISQSDVDIAVITPISKELKISLFEKKLAKKIKVYEIQLKKAEKEFLNTLANGIILSGYLNIIK